jgi:hypothetical protein
LLPEVRIGLLYPDFSDNLNYEAQVMDTTRDWTLLLFMGYFIVYKRHANAI